MHVGRGNVQNPRLQFQFLSWCLDIADDLDPIRDQARGVAQGGRDRTLIQNIADPHLPATLTVADGDLAELVSQGRQVNLREVERRVVRGIGGEINSAGGLRRGTKQITAVILFCAERQRATARDGVRTGAKIDVIGDQTDRFPRGQRLDLAFLQRECRGGSGQFQINRTVGRADSRAG